MKKIKVIIADDSPEYIRGVKALLSISGHFEIVETVENGEDLVNCRVLPEVDIILSDIQMPKMNGIDAAKQINFNNPNLKMIALTMYKDSIYLTDIISAGFKGFVHKPETARSLIDTIHKVLNNEFVFPNNIEI